MNSLQYSEGAKSFDGIAAAAMLAATAGTAFAVPSNCSGFTWQTKFDTDPDAIALQLQISLDNSNWSDLDTSTAVAGEVKFVAGYTKFVRGRINTITIGSGDGFTLEITIARGA